LCNVNHCPSLFILFFTVIFELNNHCPYSLFIISEEYIYLYQKPKKKLEEDAIQITVLKEDKKEHFVSSIFFPLHFQPLKVFIELNDHLVNSTMFTTFPTEYSDS
jgi:hypothetical protein